MFITFLNGLFIGSGRSKLLSRAGKRQQRDMLAAVKPRNLALTAIVVDPRAHTTDANALVAALAAEGIEARHLWKPMHLQPAFAAATAVTSGVAEHLFASGVTLPSGSALSDAQVERVADAVARLLTESAR